MLDKWKYFFSTFHFIWMVQRRKSCGKIANPTGNLKQLGKKTLKASLPLALPHAEATASLFLFFLPLLFFWEKISEMAAA